MNGEPVVKLPLPTGLFEILETLREFAKIRDNEGLLVACGEWRSRFGSEMAGDLGLLDCVQEEAWGLTKELLRTRETEGC